ncbi:hypothetical protein QR680_001089 [Steinernema hermaphroditum]|uniref:MIF4G domain-containing protein n=1 Tax=Steinernema hermaphroditum TaxID=289476 RepID=A0AA39GYH5_9BILA|nr:hypothetical protein QR680_001089 [Steinernema hermaphroditum]
MESAVLSETGKNEEDGVPVLKPCLQKLLTDPALTDYLERNSLVKHVLTTLPRHAECSLSYMGINPYAKPFVPANKQNKMTYADWSDPESATQRAGRNSFGGLDSESAQTVIVPTLQLPATCSIVVEKFDSDEAMFANMKATRARTELDVEISQDQMAYNSNRNPNGNGRPTNFNEPSSFGRGDLPNGHESTSSSLPSHQFRFNANAAPFVPRGIGAPSQVGVSNQGWRRDAYFGGQSDWMERDMFAMQQNQAPPFINRPATTQRRNIYGPQYSQATLDNINVYRPAQDRMQPQHSGFDGLGGSSFDNGGMFQPAARNNFIDMNSMSISFSSDPAVLQQQMEAAGLSVRFDTDLVFSEALTEQMNRQPYGDVFREICVGLEQLCRTDIPDNQCVDWDVAIKGCVHNLANMCNQHNASPHTVRELCCTIIKMIYESVFLKPGTSKRLAELVGNLIFYVPYFREDLLMQVSQIRLAQPTNVADVAETIVFLSHVYSKLVKIQIASPRLAMHIIFFITAIIEIKPITDEHFAPIVSVLKSIGEFLDQHDDVKLRLNVVLTNVLGYAIGCQQTVSARTRTEVQEIIKIREDGWISAKYRDFERSMFEEAAVLTEAEQRFLDSEIDRNTPEVSEGLDDDIQADFEKFIHASARDTALGVVNSCLEELSIDGNDSKLAEKTASKSHVRDLRSATPFSVVHERDARQRQLTKDSTCRKYCCVHYYGNGSGAPK